jgi:iron complex outermembrane receptor protein
MRNNPCTCFFMSTTLLSIGIAGATLAQDNSATNLKDITITADEPNQSIYDPVDGYLVDFQGSGTKTDTPLIETPQSISIITSDQIADQGASTLGEALRYTPGIKGDLFGYATRFTWMKIRGFDAHVHGLYRDGLQLRNPSWAVAYNIEPYSAERIEVPRGPASVLYGAGEVGGLVNFVTKRARPDMVNEVSATYGSFNRYETRFDLGGAIDETGELSYRLTGVLRDSDTQVDYINNDRVFLAPALTWQPSNSTKLSIMTHYQTDDTKQVNAYPNEGTLFSNPNGKISPSLYLGDPNGDTYEREEYSVGYALEHQLNAMVELKQTVRYHSNELKWINTGYFGELAADKRTLSTNLYKKVSDLTGLAVDNHAIFDFETGSVQHKTLVGIDYQNVKASAKSVYASGGATMDLFNPTYSAVTIPPYKGDASYRQKQTGVYVQDQLTLADQWHVVLGGRYDMTNDTTTNNLTNEKTSDQDDTAFTKRAGLVYESDYGLAPYVSYSESFQPQVGKDSSDNSLKPMTGQQYEIGLKVQPQDRNSFITLAYFDLKKQNISKTDPTTKIIEQTGEISSTGFELDVVVDLASTLELIGSYTQMDVEITSDVQNPTEVGNTPGQTVEQFGSVWANYTIPIQSRFGQNFQISGGARYQDGSYNNSSDSQYKTDSFIVADAALHYNFDSARLSLNIHNVLDKEHVTSCSGNFCYYGQKRVISATLGYRW